MWARRVRSLSNLIGVAVLVAVTIALAVGVYFLAHGYFTVSSRQLLGAELAGVSWSADGNETITLAVTVTDTGGTPMTVEGFTVYIFMPSGSTIVASDVTVSPPIPATVYPHEAQQFTLIVSNVPASALSAVVSATVATPSGAVESLTSPKVPLSSSGGFIISTTPNRGWKVLSISHPTMQQPPNTCPYGLHVELLNTSWSFDPPYIALLLNITTYYGFTAGLSGVLSNFTFVRKDLASINALLKCDGTFSMPPDSEALVLVYLSNCSLVRPPSGSLNSWRFDGYLSANLNTATGLQRTYFAIGQIHVQQDETYAIPWCVIVFSGSLLKVVPFALKVPWVC